MKPDLLVLREARRVRDELRRRAWREPWEGSLAGACLVGAIVVARRVRRLGFAAEPVYGWWGEGTLAECGAHCWTAVTLPDGEVLVDTTATQFGVRQEVVMLGPVPDGEDDVERGAIRARWHGDIRGEAAIRRVEPLWWKSDSRRARRVDEAITRRLAGVRPRRLAA